MYRHSNKQFVIRIFCTLRNNLRCPQSLFINNQSTRPIIIKHYKQLVETNKLLFPTRKMHRIKRELFPLPVMFYFNFKTILFPISRSQNINTVFIWINPGDKPVVIQPFNNRILGVIVCVIQLGIKRFTNSPLLSVAKQKH